MRIKKILFAALLSMGCMTAAAQSKATSTETFNHHWYVQGHVGGQYTTGETKFKDLVSPNAQLGLGYQFTPVWGLRMHVNAWQSRGASEIFKQPYKWKWNYVAPTINATFDVINAVAGYNPKRVVSLGLFAGVGANIAFNNDEAMQVKNDIETYIQTTYQSKAEAMSLLWTGTKPRFTGNVGADIDFKVSKRVQLGLEVSYNMVSDNYNSKKAPGMCDHYYNALVGVRVGLGKVTKTVEAEPEDDLLNSRGIERVVERIVEKPVTVHDTVYIEKREVAAREELRRDIFFILRGSEISKDEMRKVDEVVAFMNKYPDSRVTVTGYADKGTGNPKINVGYSKKRADIVAETLKRRGIAADRIYVDAKGDTEQPYSENGKNRVAICIVR